MAQRISQSGRTVFFADRDCHPQTLAVLQTRAEALGWQVVIGDPMRDIDPAAIFGALFQYPGTFGEVRDFREPIARLQGCRRHFGGGGRSARADAAQAAGRARSRHRHRVDATFRRPDGLWRSACRLYRHQGRPQARAARSAGRRFGRQPREQGLPAGAADPRAAHPAREGDIEHLHGAGPAGRDCFDVCGLSRSRGPAGDCPPRARDGRSSQGAAW